MTFNDVFYEKVHNPKEKDERKKKFIIDFNASADLIKTKLNEFYRLKYRSII